MFTPQKNPYRFVFFFKVGSEFTFNLYKLIQTKSAWENFSMLHARIELFEIFCMALRNWGIENWNPLRGIEEAGPVGGLGGGGGAHINHQANRLTRHLAEHVNSGVYIFCKMLWSWEGNKKTWLLVCRGKYGCRVKKWYIGLKIDKWGKKSIFFLFRLPTFFVLFNWRLTLDF